MHFQPLSPETWRHLLVLSSIELRSCSHAWSWTKVDSLDSPQRSAALHMSPSGLHQLPSPVQFIPRTRRESEEGLHVDNPAGPASADHLDSRIERARSANLAKRSPSLPRQQGDKAHVIKEQYKWLEDEETTFAGPPSRTSSATRSASSELAPLAAAPVASADLVAHEEQVAAPPMTEAELLVEAYRTVGILVDDTEAESLDKEEVAPLYLVPR